MKDIQILEYLDGFVIIERIVRFSQVLEERTKYLTIEVPAVY